MNIKNIALTLALVASAGTALAGDRSFPHSEQTVASNKTRAEVIVELKDAQARKQIFLGDHDNTKAANSVAGKSRSDVQAELVAAIRNNEIEVIHN